VGYLEGYLTPERIQQMYINLVAQTWGSPDQIPTDLINFLQDQDEWMRGMVQNNQTDLWQGMGLIVAQYDGIVKAYTEQSTINQSLEIPPYSFMILSAMGDLLDLTNIFPASGVEPVDWFNLPPQNVSRKVAMMGHCSALVKMLGNYSDIFMAHSTWFAFQSMNRIYKHYQFTLSAPYVATKTMSFSSYPGVLASIDDFYMLSPNGLVMLETTNGIFNTDLYKYVVPQSLLAWHRVRLANMMADSGEQWAFLVAQYNSGTYNNQYMIIDTKLFTPNEPLVPNTLWIIEQIPGLVESADETATLSRGYWPSYNVPFFEKIANISGWSEMEKKNPSMSYQLAPRAELFRRDQGNVVDLKSMQYLMRENNYKTDPYSHGDPGNAICSRFDLETSDPYPSGCYDSKITSFSLMKSFASESISGPTAQGLPPFSWAAFPEFIHAGQPEVFNFDFLNMQPQLNWDE